MISFEQPQPVDTKISEDYGAAQQYNATLPTLAGMQEAAARLSLQAAQSAAANRQAGAAGSERTREFDLSQRQQADEFQTGQDTQANLAQLHGQNQMAAQAQAAQLQSWANQQDITQKENLRIQQLQNGIAATNDAVANGTLTPEQGNQAILDMKTPLEMLKAKQTATQTRLEEAQSKKIQQENAKSTTMMQQDATYRAKSAQDRTSTVLNPVVKAQVEQEVIDAGLGDHPGFDEIVAKETARRPNGARFLHEFEPGKTKELDFGDPKAAAAESKSSDAEMKQYDTEHAAWLKHHVEYQKAYEKAFQAEEDKNDLLVKGDTDSSGKSKGNYRKATEEELRAAAERRVSIPKPGEEPKRPTRGEKKAEKSGTDSVSGTAPTAQPAPTSPAPAPAPQPQAAVPAQPPPKSAVAVLDDTIKALNQRPGISADTKMVVNAAIEDSKAMLAKAGGYKNLSVHEKAIYDHNEKLVERALKAAPPVPPPPAPLPVPPPAPQDVPVDPRQSIYQRQR